jgi:hypothetical protein
VPLQRCLSSVDRAGEAPLLAWTARPGGMGRNLGHHQAADRTVMSGGSATWHENQLVPITRNGRREDVYWTYSYGPIDDPASPNGIGGVLVVCAETTATVTAERRMAAQMERHQRLFDQAPSFMAMLEGPEHRFSFVNAAYMRLVGDRPVIEKTVARALPDAAAQGYVNLLDRVFQSGEAFTSSAGASPLSARIVGWQHRPWAKCHHCQASRADICHAPYMYLPAPQPNEVRSDRDAVRITRLARVIGATENVPV